MRPLYLIAAAGIAWWYLTRPQPADAALEATNPYKASGPQTVKGGAGSWAPGDVLTVAGLKYRVAAPATDAGLVPVTLVPAPGMVATAVLRWYDPAQHRIVGA